MERVFPIKKARGRKHNIFSYLYNQTIKPRITNKYVKHPKSPLSTNSANHTLSAPNNSGWKGRTYSQMKFLPCPNHGAE